MGGIERGRPPFEAGCSSKDTDFLHLTNWKKAEEMVKAGKVSKVNGMYLIPISQAVKEGLLYLIPEPKSPHGVDVSPDGKYLVALNKLKPVVRYKSGWDSRSDKRSPYKTRAGREKTERSCDADGKCKVAVYGTTIRSHITPEIIEVEEGDEVSIHLTNLERAQDEVHGFAMYGQNVQLSIEPGKTASATFVADKAGVYPYYCTEFCSAPRPISNSTARKKSNSLLAAMHQG